MRALALLLVAVLAGCGFRLAGDRPLPPALQRVHIDVVAPYRVSEPPVETHLRTLLRRRGAEVSDRLDAGVVAIRLSDLETHREVLSIGLDGKALEFALVTRVRVLVSRDGDTLLPQTELEVSRDFSFNAQQVLSKEAEEERLRRYIQAEIAEVLLLRLEAVLGRVPTPTLQP